MSTELLRVCVLCFALHLPRAFVTPCPLDRSRDPAINTARLVLCTGETKPVFRRLGFEVSMSLSSSVVRSVLCNRTVSSLAGHQDHV